MNNHLKSKTPHLPDLSTKEIIELQNTTSSKLSVPCYFSDKMKIGESAPEMAVIPSGLFEMGSNSNEFGHYKDEYPQHYIQINKPFAIGRYAITANDFEIFRKDTEWYLRPELLWAKNK